MKPTHKIIKLVFSLYVIVIGQNAFGQVPPERYEICPNIMLEFTQEEIFNYREYFTLFNHYKINDSLENELKYLNYKSYSSFVAPKGIKKLTLFYYSEITEGIPFAPTKFEFYYNSKTKLLEKEIIYTTNRNSLLLEKTHEYIYEYFNNGENEIITKSLNINNEHDLSIKFIYSQNKKLLLKRIESSGERREIEYCYDKDATLNNIIIDGNNSTFTAKQEKEYPLDENSIKNSYPWLKKDYWIHEFSSNEEIIQSIDFPKTLDSKGIFKYLEFHSKGNVKNESTSYYYLNFNTPTTTYKKYRLFPYDNYKYIRDPIAMCNYEEKNFALFDDNNNLELAFLWYTSGRWNTYSLNLINIERNTYTLKYLKTSSINNQPMKECKEYGIKTKNVKGLNEVYIIKDNKIYPLVTIN